MDFVRSGQTIFPETIYVGILRNRHRGWRSHLARACAALALLALSGCGTVASPTPEAQRSGTAAAAPLGPGAPAPAFELPDVRGGSFDLSATPETPALIAFLHTETATASEPASQSRSQVVFLRSMETQYKAKGLQVAIVDATALATGRAPSDEALLNVSYDWQLEAVAVLKDDGSRLAREFGVQRAPTTFLVGADGRIVQRWEGFVPAAQLAFALNDLVGTPELK